VETALDASVTAKAFPDVLPVRVSFDRDGGVLLKWDDGDENAVYRVLKSTSPDFAHAALVMWRDVKGTSWQDLDTRPGPAFYRIERLNG
jgi:hypothetical protein